jgi:TonB family protein
MGDEDRKNDKCGAGRDTYETTVMDFLDKEMSVSSGSVNDMDSQADDVDILVDRILRQAIAAAEGKAVPAASGPDELVLPLEGKPVERRMTVTEKGDDSPVSPPVEARVEIPQSAQPSPVIFQDREEAVPLPVFAMAARKPAWQGRIFLLCGASLCLLAGAGIVYLTNTQGRSPARQAQPISTPAPATPAKAEVVVLPVVAAESGSTVPGMLAGTARSGSGPRAPERREVPRPAENPNADPAGSAAAINAPQAAEKTNPGGEVIASAVADTRPSTGGTAAVNPAAESPAQPPEKAAAPPASQNEAPPVATFAQLTSNSNANLQNLATLRKPAIQTPPLSIKAIPAAVISRVMPVYPELARRSRTWGTVVLEVQIDEQGRPVKAVAESGPGILHDAAVKAVMQWRFKPATLDGVTVTSTTKVTIVFTNQNQNGDQR